jgi:hypothetical protein
LEEEMSKVIVTGGRDFNDREAVFTILDILNPDMVIHGGANGADYLAGEWAKIRRKICTIYYADWDKNGRAAGPIRNSDMLKANRDAKVVAFKGGTGTAHCKTTAMKLGMEVIDVPPREDG